MALFHTASWACVLFRSSHVTNKAPFELSSSGASLVQLGRGRDANARTAGQPLQTGLENGADPSTKERSLPSSGQLSKCARFSAFPLFAWRSIQSSPIFFSETSFFF